MGEKNKECDKVKENLKNSMRRKVEETVRKAKTGGKEMTDRESPKKNKSLRGRMRG